MSHAGVTWLSLLLDTAEEHAEPAEVFWSRVTGWPLSTRRGARKELATLLPEAGDAFLRVQRVGHTPPGGVHLDLHSDDVDALAGRAERLGASASYAEPGLVVCGSPGGMTFCVVASSGARSDGGPGRAPPTGVWPGGGSALDQVCLDVPPSAWEAECAFWASLLGRRAGPGTSGRPEFSRLWPAPAARPPGPSDDRVGAVRILLQRLDREQPTVTAHLDWAAEDVQAEVARHVVLGAATGTRHEGWTTMTDPAGRTYCVTARPPRPRDT